MAGFVVLAIIAVVLFGGMFIEAEMRRREAKRMISQGYRWEFVITCSADPGSWQWVKR